MSTTTSKKYNQSRSTSTTPSDSTSTSNSRPSSKPQLKNLPPPVSSIPISISTNSMTPTTPSSAILTEEDLLKGEDMLGLAKCFDLKEAEQYFKASLLFFIN